MNSPTRWESFIQRLHKTFDPLICRLFGHKWIELKHLDHWNWRENCWEHYTYFDSDSGYSRPSVYRTCLRCGRMKFERQGDE